MTDARAAAAERLRARAARLGMIRRRVAATVLAIFALAFGLITTTGAMGSQGTTVASTTTTPSPSTTSNDDQGTIWSDPGSTSSSAGQTTVSPPAAMTTHQS
jgi:hypothetical protein